MAFDVEVIPDQDLLFRRVHELHWIGGQVSSAAFTDTNLSVNWCRYSSAEATAIATSAAVASIAGGSCRNLGQDVVHSPMNGDDGNSPNQAHSVVRGQKTKMIKRKLKEMATVVWQR